MDIMNITYNIYMLLEMELDAGAAMKWYERCHYLDAMRYCMCGVVLRICIHKQWTRTRTNMKTIVDMVGHS